MTLLVMGVLSGFFSTYIMDLASIIGSKLKLTARTSPILIGRWFKIIFTKGKVFHSDIRKVEPWKHEKILGTFIHYLIGAILGIIFLIIWKFASLNPTNLVDDIIYGFATSVFAWFFMFPAFGFGFFGKHSPPEFPAFRTSTVTHVSFGIGLAIWFNMLNVIFHIHVF